MTISLCLPFTTFVFSICKTFGKHRAIPVLMITDVLTLTLFPRADPAEDLVFHKHLKV